MTKLRMIIILLVAIGAAGAFFLLRQGGGHSSMKMAYNGERKIEYWVAPMDPNYRRDKPGKSPMGMELIPVYEGGENSGGEPSLKINASVVQNIGVKTADVAREDMARDINTVGSIMIDEEARSDIHVRSEGWIEKLHVEAVGEKVEAGDVLFELYAPALVAAQSEFIQALKIGRAPLIAAATERLTALGMSVDQIAELRRTQKTMRRVAVAAPQSGVVTMLNARDGMYLKPSDMALRLADLSNVWLIADVFDTEAAWVSAGDHAVMTLPAFPGETWEGEVDYVYPTAEMMTRTVQVRLRFPNPGDRLRPNMFANVEIGAEPKEGVLTIPQSAVIRSSKGDRVILALGDGRFRPAEVKTGMESGGKVEVLAGLAEGERVVIESQFLIDSEASLDAGLLRMAPLENEETTPMEMDGMSMSEMNTPANDMKESDAVGAEGRVVSVDMDAKSVTIDHKPVPEIGWPSMVMAFMAPAKIDLMSVKAGEPVRFAFRETDTGYELDMIEPMPEDGEAGDEQ
ncbi:efflux RND transporter periplasmic adaptor subunit [Hyphococcus sp.]|uniref:efflux RND transporter periplasmic adaptor subunit n=1 Tax=Hyphococcus sp. TaxID=2038636 RepID=UPI002086D919|nr:MAG: hemolysin D [Marinicaulis sp.]